jgi:hypothetical protein
MPRTWPLAWLPPLLAHVVGSGPVPIQRLLLVGGALAMLNVGIMLFLQGRAERAARKDDAPAAADAPAAPDRWPCLPGDPLLMTDRAHPCGSRSSPEAGSARIVAPARDDSRNPTS